MIDNVSHYATCLVWSTGDWKACNCWYTAEWRIRKEPAELFAWRIWHWSFETMTYEHLMRCSTFEGAIALVDQFVWMRKNALTGGLHD